MKLYEINVEIEKFLSENLDEETGEIRNPELLDALQIARDEKLEAISLYVKSLSSDAAAIREEERTLAERRKAKERKAESLRDFLERELAGNKLETPRVSVTFRKTQSVRVDDADAAIESLWSGGFADAIRYKAEIDKTAVKRLLKDGREIQGVSLAESLSMSIK